MIVWIVGSITSLISLCVATMMAWTVEQMEIMDSVFGDDPWPYGVESNRKTLAALMRYLVEQSLIAKPLPLESIFVPVSP